MSHIMKYRIWFRSGGYTETRDTLLQIAMRYREGEIRKIEALS